MSECYRCRTEGLPCYACRNWRSVRYGRGWRKDRKLMRRLAEAEAKIQMILDPTGKGG